MKFLLLDSYAANNKALAALIQNCLILSQNGLATFYEDEPEIVFKAVLPTGLTAVFISLNSMADVEAAKQLARVYAEIPLVAMSGAEDYSIESYRFGARYYINRSALETEITEALRRLAV